MPLIRKLMSRSAWRGAQALPHKQLNTLCIVFRPKVRSLASNVCLDRSVTWNNSSDMFPGVICLEEFTSGSTVARLSCFCSFHNRESCSYSARGTTNKPPRLPFLLAATREKLSRSRSLKAFMLFRTVCRRCTALQLGISYYGNIYYLEIGYILLSRLLPAVRRRYCNGVGSHRCG